MKKSTYHLWLVSGALIYLAEAVCFSLDRYSFYFSVLKLFISFKVSGEKLTISVVVALCFHLFRT